MKKVDPYDKFKDKLSSEIFFKEFYDNLKSLRQIAIEYNVNRNALGQYAKTCGIKARDVRSGIRGQIEGKTFGFLKVLRFIGKKKWNNLWECECVCGNIKILRTSDLKKTISCGCKKNIIGKDGPCWKGYGDISASIFSNIKSHAYRRTLEFDVTIEYIWQLYLDQDRKCVLTGLPIIFAKNRSKMKTASLDRIDSNKGYTSDNVQWVHKVVNVMKQNLSDTEFIQWCTLVADHKREIALDTTKVA